jgi:hypothetical protein
MSVCTCGFVVVNANEGRGLYENDDNDALSVDSNQ